MAARIVKRPQERRIRAILPDPTEVATPAMPAEAPNSPNSALSLFSQPYTPPGRRRPAQRHKRPAVQSAPAGSEWTDVNLTEEQRAELDLAFPDVPLTPERIEEIDRAYQKLLKARARGSWVAVRPVATWGIPEVQLPAGDWTRELDALDAFFIANPPPPPAINLDGHTRIGDPGTFIASHLATCRAYNGRPAFLPYLERLRTLRDRTDADPFPPFPRPSDGPILSCKPDKHRKQSKHGN
jgi:hypothetical protein